MCMRRIFRLFQYLIGFLYLVLVVYGEGCWGRVEEVKEANNSFSWHGIAYVIQVVAKQFAIQTLSELDRYIGRC
jgi:hypothetical protein